MPFSRRQFLQYGAGGAALGAGSLRRAHALFVPVPAAGATPAEYQEAMAVRADAKTMRDLAARAVDVAKAAGATYADARLTRSVFQLFAFPNDSIVGAVPEDSETLAFGVRALVGGIWGFAASPYWTPDEAARLATDAVAEAKAGAKGSRRRVELGSIPAATGDWTSLGIDPFTVPVEEKIEWMNAWRQAINEFRHPKVSLGLTSADMRFIREERVLVSTEGTSVAQTRTMSRGTFPVLVSRRGWRANTRVPMTTQGLEERCQGWEMFRDAKVLDQLPELAERGDEALSLSRRPVDVGRYNVVFSGETMAALLAATVGAATQLDQAIGDEVIATGTNYLGPDPLALLGTFQAASPLVTVTADRSTPTALATVKWDDDGVVPEDFTLIKDGVLVDYQTTREQASWLAPYYQKVGKPVRSHGCAWSTDAHLIPMQQPPNIMLAPAAGSATFDQLVADTKRGIAVISGLLGFTSQGRNGACQLGMARTIVNGKLGPVCQNAGFLFDSIELWKNVMALGGDASTVRKPMFLTKGEPDQQGTFDARAVPALVKDVTIIDVMRRA